MCLAIPSKVLSIDLLSNSIQVDTLGTQREAKLHLMMDPPEIGTYVLIHANFVMDTLSEEDALESLKVYKELIDNMQMLED
jgi:hydrogenase expression/formation protein HypC